MASRLLVLLALLAAATQAAGYGSCGTYYWPCSDGSRCIDAYKRCNGASDCGDGSDEKVCDELPTVTLPVYATATARVQYVHEVESILLDLCGVEHCSRVRLIGEQANRTMMCYVTYTGCNRLGMSCSDSKSHGSHHYYFARGEVVLMAQHRPGQIAVWRQEQPHDVVTVPVQDDYSTLRVRPEYWKIDIPVQFNVSSAWLPSLAPAGRPAPSCGNGGIHDGHVCLCPPGFDGHSCQIACGPDHHGEGCAQRCSGTLTAAGRGCDGVRFCRAGDCTCAAGLRGPQCDQVCSPGHYGANCTQLCGFCSGERVCDPFTGHCPQGCSSGFNPPYCLQPFSHLINGVNVTSITDSSLNATISTAADHIVGSGQVHFYELQYKEDSSAVWTVGCIGSLTGADVYTCFIDGLRPNTSYQVRGILRNDKMEGYTNVPHISVHTDGRRKISDLVVREITAASFRVSWDSPAAEEGDFFIMYQCQELLGCPGVSCEHVKGAHLVRGKTILIEGLVPFSNYRIVVSRDEESDTMTATTLSRVPDALVSNLETTHLTNVTAVVRWQHPRVCAQINGPPNNFFWQLLSPPSTETLPAVKRSGYTNTMVLMLRDLDPLTMYELRVSIINAVGGNPARWAHVLFNTTNTVPDAPRQLDVYRLNSTTVWVHWKIPAKPSGKIREYIVTVQGPGVQRDERVAPASVCPAWPELVCHRIGGLKAHTQYAISVRAVNDLGDEPGEPANLLKRTEVGVPGPPEHLQLVETLSRSLTIQWQLPQYIHADLTHFEVLLTPLHDDVGRPRREEVDVTEERPVYLHTISGLVPNAMYNVSVRCGWNGQEAHLPPTKTAAE